ncbi:MAG: hypothetical protein WA405_07470 [Candidatus Acidiferrales bacterium]
MRKVLFIAGLLLFTSGIARASCARFEVGGGYAYTRVTSLGGFEGTTVAVKSVYSGGSSTTVNLNGWDAEADYNLTCWLGIVANFSGVYASPFGYSTHVYTETFGPRVYFFGSGPIRPFVQALFGAGEAHCSYDGATCFSQTAFAGNFGGGVQVSIGGPWAVEGDVGDVTTHFFNQYQNSLGIVAKVVFRFGGH